MKHVILCEGKTDAILLSYFLIKEFGWSYIKESVISFSFDKQNEILNWYNHPGKPLQELAIWGVGGIDEMPKKLFVIADRTKHERKLDNRFEKVVLFFDRAGLKNRECVQLVRNWSTDADLKLRGKKGIGRWINATLDLRTQPPQQHQLKILPVVLPPTGKGELETFLLDSLRTQSSDDLLLVDSARSFIHRLPNRPYLVKNRFRPKACLGSVLSVISPDWVFSKLHKRLTRIEWEKLPSVATVYGQLKQL